MYQVEAPRDDSSLVTLEGANEVRRNPEPLTPASQLLFFLYGFLDAILTDVGKAGVQRRANRFRPKPFGHRDDRDRLWGTSRKLGPHLGQTLREGLETHSR